MALREPGGDPRQARARRFHRPWCWPQTVRVVPDDLSEYLATVVLGSHLERLDAADHEPFVAAVRAELDDDGIDYVRLNVLARSAS